VCEIRDQLMASNVPALLSDLEAPDEPIFACNDVFAQFSGFRLSEILGQNCQLLNRGIARDEPMAAPRTAVYARQICTQVIRNCRKDGSPFDNGGMLLRITDVNGRAVAILGSQIDLTRLDPTSRLSAFYRARSRMNCLSKRQKQVTVAMANGKLIKEIGHELGITERTVKMHRASALKALDVSKSVEAIRIAIEAGY